MQTSLRTPSPHGETEFKTWFGDSRVVDSDGKPAMMYHSGWFDEREDAEPRIRPEGMHFGTEDAAMMRQSGKRHDDIVREATYEQDRGAEWLARQDQLLDDGRDR